MAFVEEPGQATTSGGQNDRGKAPAFSTEVSPAYEAQSEGENENERLLLFSDGIIAFTITLATISIRLPSDKPIAELPTLLTDLYPNLITYLIGFVIVGSYWYEHWRFFRYIKHSTTTLDVPLSHVPQYQALECVVGRIQFCVLALYHALVSSYQRKLAV